MTTDREPVSLRTAPCGDQAPHGAHTYGAREHTCLGIYRSMCLATADATALEGDKLVAVLSPDAHLVTDASTCIVLRTPERRITVSNVDDWREQLFTARTWAAVYRDDAETRRRDEAGAARQMKAAHCQRMRDKDTLIEHLNRSPDHGTNTAGELQELQVTDRLDLIRLHMKKHGLR